MCLIGVRIDDHPDYPLMVAANRDEFHRRAAQAADWWDDCPALLAGRDLQARGTWLGITRSGRFAAVTNIRGRAAAQDNAPSRGQLVVDFLTSETAAYHWAEELAHRSSDWAGFHLLAFDGKTMVRVSQDRPGLVAKLSSGSHALSNQGSREPSWEKCERMRAQLRTAGVERTRALADLMHSLEHDREQGVVSNDPVQISQRSFIKHPEYGTRCATSVLMSRHGEVEFLERRYDAEGNVSGETHRSFALEN